LVAAAPLLPWRLAATLIGGATVSSSLLSLSYTLKS